MPTPLRLLLVEDSEDDATLVIRHLQHAGHDVTFERVEDAESCANALEHGTWDLVIADYNLPSFSGLDALRIYNEKGVDAPFIIVSGEVGEDIAVSAMKAGAHDYVMKGNLKRLLPAIERELRDAEVRRARKRTEAELQANEIRYRELTKYTDNGVLVFEVNNDGEDFIVREFNLAAGQIEGVKREDVIGRNVLEVLLGVKPCGLFAVFQRVWRTGTAEHFAVSHYQNGRVTGWRDNFVYRLPSGEIVTIYQDVTERKLAEQTIRESEQRLTDIVGFLPDATMVVDARGEVIAWNRAIEELTGVSAAKMIGKGDYEYALPFYGVRRPILVDCVLDPERELADNYQNVERSDDTLIAETLLPTLRGKRTYVWIAARALRDAMGNVTGAIESIRDITARKRAEDELRASEARYRELIEQTNNGVVVYEAIKNGKDFIVKEFNRSAERIEGIKREQVLQKSVLEVFPGMKEFGLFGVLQRVWKTGAAQHFAPALYRDQRICGWRENHVYKLPTGEIVAVYQDVTERKQTEEKIQQLADFPAENPYPVMRVNENGRLQYANGASASILTHWKIQLGEQLSEYWMQTTTAALADGSPRQIEITVDGVIYAVTLAPVIAKRYLNMYWFDITERKQAEEALTRTHRRLEQALRFTEALLSAVPAPVFYKDKEGRYLGCNRAFSETMGVTSEEIKGRTVYELWPGEHARTYHDKDLELMRNATRQVYEFKVRDKDGVDRPVIYVKDVFCDENDEVAGIVGAFMDITERKLAEEGFKEAHNRLQATLSAIPDIIFEIDQKGRIYDYRAPEHELLYVPPEEFLGKSVREVLPESAASIILQAIADAARDGWSQGAVYALDLPAGQRWFELSIAAKGDQSAQDARFIALARDITERIQAVEKLRYAGTHDSLTALYNRAYFEEEVRRSERGRTFPVSVALADVDSLKEVNDTLGHAAGDDLLRRVGQVLLAAFRTEDVVARIGGDEFAVLLPGVDEAMADDAIQRVKMLLAAQNRSVGGSSLSLSFGVATGEKGCSLNSVLRKADDLMYADKLSKCSAGADDTTRKKAAETTPRSRLRLTNVGTNIQMKDTDSEA